MNPSRYKTLIVSTKIVKTIRAISDPLDMLNSLMQSYLDVQKYPIIYCKLIGDAANHSVLYLVFMTKCYARHQRVLLRNDIFMTRLLANDGLCRGKVFDVITSILSVNCQPFQRKIFKTGTFIT